MYIKQTNVPKLGFSIKVNVPNIFPIGKKIK